MNIVCLFPLLMYFPPSIFQRQSKWAATSTQQNISALINHEKVNYSSVCVLWPFIISRVSDALSLPLLKESSHHQQMYNIHTLPSPASYPADFSSYWTWWNPKAVSTILNIFQYIICRFILLGYILKQRRNWRICIQRVLAVMLVWWTTWINRFDFCQSNNRQWLVDKSSHPIQIMQSS